jgi:hypothetical protein
VFMSATTTATTTTNAERLHDSVMETLGGFPNPPALWLRRAAPAYANAIVDPSD